MSHVAVNSINLILGDCLEKMKDIPDGSVDMICTDLPYGTTACSWDTVIPFQPLWEQYKRIIKKNGVVVLFGSQPFTTDLIMSNRKWFRYEWIWEKEQGTNFQSIKYVPLKCHENVCIFSGGTNTYNAQLGKGTPFISGKGVSEGVYGKTVKVQVENFGTRYPKSVIKFNRSTGQHPTQKPVPLCEYLIRTYTNEGETVLDSCMGSGTTGVACVATKRNFIGIEKDEEYFKIAQERINNAQLPLL